MSEQTIADDLDSVLAALERLRQGVELYRCSPFPAMGMWHVISSTPENGREWVIAEMSGGPAWVREARARYIAALLNAAPRLLAELARLRRVEAAAQGVLAAEGTSGLPLAIDALRRVVAGQERNTSAAATLARLPVLNDPVISDALSYAAWASESGDESYEEWLAAHGQEEHDG